jgi:hypothetical protein
LQLMLSDILVFNIYCILARIVGDLLQITYFGVSCSVK